MLNDSKDASDLKGIKTKVMFVVFNHNNNHNPRSTPSAEIVM